MRPGKIFEIFQKYLYFRYQLIQVKTKMTKEQIEKVFEFLFQKIIFEGFQLISS